MADTLMMRVAASLAVRDLQTGRFTTPAAGGGDPKRLLADMDLEGIAVAVPGPTLAFVFPELHARQRSDASIVGFDRNELCLGPQAHRDHGTRQPSFPPEQPGEDRCIQLVPHLGGVDTTPPGRWRKPLERGPSKTAVR